MVKSEQPEFEVDVAAVAVGSALQESDFVVGAFQRTGGDRMVVPVQEANAVSA